MMSDEKANTLVYQLDIGDKFCLMRLERRVFIISRSGVPCISLLMLSLDYLLDSERLVLQSLKSIQFKMSSSQLVSLL